MPEPSVDMGMLIVLPHHPVIQMAQFPLQKKEGSVLFNDALNMFYLRLYGVRHIVKDHSNSERKPTAATWATLSD